MQTLTYGSENILKKYECLLFLLRERRRKKSIYPKYEIISGDKQYYR